MNFNRWIHFVALVTVAALAYACGVERVRPLIAFPVYGLALGLAGAFVVRLFL